MRRKGPPPFDLTGHRYGRFVVLAAAGRGKCGVRRWLCRCDCGTERVVFGNSLRSGVTQSCGCRRAENAAAKLLVHGMTGTPEHNAWGSMLDRCRNPKNARYLRYGARGIVVCERWMLFENFLADMRLRPPGMSLDRIDNDGNYEPGNCRWATSKQQRRNTSTNRVVEIHGDRRALSEWAERLGLKPATLWSRIKRGQSPEQAAAYSVHPRPARNGGASR